MSKNGVMTMLMLVASLSLGLPQAWAYKAIPLTKAEKEDIVGGRRFRQRVRIRFRDNTTTTLTNTTAPTDGVVNQTTSVNVSGGVTTITINGQTTVVNGTPTVIKQSNVISGWN